MVDPATACDCDIRFSAASIDDEAGTSGSPTHADDEQVMKVDPTKTMQKKLVIVLNGIHGGPGPGGIFGYAVGLGFHGFMVATQTDESSAPDEYENVDTEEAKRQVADARLEAWDGVDRVSWLDVKRPDSVEQRTERALVHAAKQDPGGDWSYYLNTDGSVRWTDVMLVGYSFGSQTIAMVSKYRRFGRALLTSGPTDEDFPDAAWISEPSATPLDRMFMMVGAEADYPPASGDVGDKIDTALAAGWIGPPLNVHENAAPGTFGSSHILVLKGQGHSEMCAGDGGPWKSVCDYAFGVGP